MIAGSPGLLVEARNLTKAFPMRKGLLSRKVGEVRAVDGVSFQLRPGEVLGLVGESGCGKTTTGRLILRLLEPTSGRVYFDGQDITEIKGVPLRRLRRRMQIIFQDPFGSLNPRMTVRSMLLEPLRIHDIARGAEAEIRITDLLEAVGLSPDQMNKYPHEFSAGQRQRIGIARALTVEPDLIVADEPVSALDVSVQAQIINLLQDLKSQYGLTYIFISHDLSVVRHICDRVAVMYLGKIVEVAERDALYDDPQHPYTQMLLAAVPELKPRRKRGVIVEGDAPSPMDPPAGCSFHPRCPKRFDPCDKVEPGLLPVPGNRDVRCHLFDEGAKEGRESARVKEI